MTENAEQRLAEAREHQWLGEVSALEENLVHLRRPRDEAERLKADLQDAKVSAQPVDFMHAH
jgi:hypothetical protein